jgi:guanine deaminase
MSGLGKMAKEYKVPIQSHISENKGEVAWVKELHPDLNSYAKV